MSEEKVTAPKRASKKVGVAAESAPAKKAATPKSKSVSSAKSNAVPDAPIASAASKISATKSKSKSVTEVAVVEQAKPKKTVAPAKPEAAIADNSTATKAPAKSTSKTTAASKPSSAKAKSESKVPAVQKLVEKPVAPSPEERQRWIATAAYHRAAKRGFAPGYEVQDWFDAEKEIDALVGKG